MPTYLKTPPLQPWRPAGQSAGEAHDGRTAPHGPARRPPLPPAGRELDGGGAVLKKAHHSNPAGREAGSGCPGRRRKWRSWTQRPKRRKGEDHGRRSRPSGGRRPEVGRTREPGPDKVSRGARDRQRGVEHGSRPKRTMRGSQAARRVYTASRVTWPERAGCCPGGGEGSAGPGSAARPRRP